MKRASQSTIVVVRSANQRSISGANQRFVRGANNDYQTARSEYLRLMVIGMVLTCAFSSGCRPSTPEGLSLAEVKDYAAAEVQIERLRKQKDSPTDWAAIEQQLQITRPMVKDIDAAFGLTYEEEIAAALRKCKSGERPKVHQQVLAKGLQHVTVAAIGRELDAMAKASGDERSAAAARISALFEGIRPTFVRRDSDYFSGEKALEPAADAALEQLKSAAESGEIFGPRKSLEEAIARTYALCVLYEIEEIEKLREKDLAACDVKRMEAVIFYRIIEDRIRRFAPDADATISAILDAGYDKMDVPLLVANLRNGLPGIPLK